MKRQLRGVQDGLLRPVGGGDPRVTPIELFFDLVYVFAFTQLSHLLLSQLTGGGAVRVLLLLFAVWWAWVYTSWITSWFDPERPAVRLLLIVIMLVSLLMSASIPGAFGGQALLFAVTYLLIQVGRTVFVLVVLGPSHQLWTNFLRVLAWFGVSAVGWLLGAIVGGRAQLALWAVAVAVEYVGPLVGFRTPRLGRSDTRLWTIEGRHFAERCQLLIMIALGESVLITGATAAQHPVTLANTVMFLVAFLGSAAMWWIYFGHAAEIGSRILAEADDPGRIARSAYNYFHTIMIAGIIVTAVGDEISIAHPGHHASPTETAVMLGGPALYLAGNLLFKYRLVGSLSRSRLIAVAVLVAAGALYPLRPPLILLAGVAATVLVPVAVMDTVVLWRAARRQAETEQKTEVEQGVSRPGLS